MPELMDRSRDIGKFAEKEEDGLIICRCEEITKGEIRKAVHDGMWTLSEIKRFIRPGMGLCQGQTCGLLVKKIVAEELGISVTSLEETTARGPAGPVEMSVYRKGMRQYEQQL